MLFIRLHCLGGGRRQRRPGTAWFQRQYYRLIGSCRHFIPTFPVSWEHPALTRDKGISFLSGAFQRQSRFMLHLIKLCVGVDSLQELADWQKKRLKEKRAKGQKPELMHVTRQMPKRAEELLDGGSLYWVIRGQIMARQTLLELREVKKNG